MVGNFLSTNAGDPTDLADSAIEWRQGAKWRGGDQFVYARAAAILFLMREHSQAYLPCTAPSGGSFCYFTFIFALFLVDFGAGASFSVVAKC